MTQNSADHLEAPKDEIHASRWSRLMEFFHRRSHPGISLSPTVFSPLYLACQKGDAGQVESCLKKLKLEEINARYPPNNETVLHVATRNQHGEIIKILLERGVQPSLRNSQDQQASQLATSEEIKQLFKRSQPSRFAFSQGYSDTASSRDHKLVCKSCSLVDTNTMYEWEIVDRNASQKALIFRREFKAHSSINTKLWRKKLYSLNKGYLTAHPQDRSTTNGKVIYDCFQHALNEQNPNYLITAYTSFQSFATLLNIDMARNVIHNLKNGCSQFSCQCLYSTEDGTRIISNLFLHHPNFEELKFKGEVHRGIVMRKDQLDHYKVGSCIITTTFLSTSKDPSVAQSFGDPCVPNSEMHSFFCTYKILNNDDRTAIDISNLSKHPEEDEVLILPYSPFLITNIVEEGDRTNIYLEEQSLTNMLDRC